MMLCDGVIYYRMRSGGGNCRLWFVRVLWKTRSTVHTVVLREAHSFLVVQLGYECMNLSLVRISCHVQFTRAVTF